MTRILFVAAFLLSLCVDLSGQVYDYGSTNAASNVTFVQAGTNAKTQTVADTLKQQLFASQFTTIQDAINAASNNVLWVTQGNYPCTSLSWGTTIDILVILQQGAYVGCPLPATDARHWINDQRQGGLNASQLNGGVIPQSAKFLSSNIDRQIVDSALSLVTTVGTPGSDTNIATEKAVRTAIAAGATPSVTTVGTPGSDSYVPTEKAVRSAIDALAQVAVFKSLTMLPIPDPATDSYSNPGGSGAGRSSIITVSIDSQGNGASFTCAAATNLPNLVSNVNAGCYWQSASVAGRWFKFNFGTPRQISEITFYLSNNGQSHGIWRWQGSNDNTTWTDVSADININTTAASQIMAITNTSLYQYFRMYGISGNTGDWGYGEYFEFKISADTGLTTTIMNYGRESVFGGVQFIGNTKPTCNASSRDLLFVEPGAVGVADQPYLCAKKSDNSYAWIQLVTVP